MQLPPSSKYLARRDESVSDDERESLARRLATEYEAGRLTQDRYMELLDQLYAAKSLGELVPVVQHVPDATADVPPIVAAGTGTPGELAPISTTSLRPIAVAGSIIGGVLILIVCLALLL